MKVTTEQCDEIIAAVERVRDDLLAVYDLDRKLAHAAKPDGFRTNLRALDGARSSSDDEGEPLPRHADPTGTAVVALLTGRSSYVKKELGVMSEAVSAMVALARQADGARARALATPTKKDTTPPGCRNHEQHEMGWEPVHCQDRCRWCYDFWSAEGFDAPRTLLEKRSRGQRISEADVERAVPHRQSKRARKRRRKAS